MSSRVRGRRHNHSHISVSSAPVQGLADPNILSMATIARATLEVGAEDPCAEALGLARAAAAWPPDERAARWARTRAVVSAAAGPGDLERMLLRVAVEWAAAATSPLTDRLDGLEPSGWIACCAGGEDPLAMRLLG